MAFSRSGSFLVAGSDKGRFWIFDRLQGQAQTYQGTHCERITDGAWNPRKQFALCSDDHSISNLNGEVVARREFEDTSCSPNFVLINSQLVLVFSEKNRPIVYVWRFERGDDLMPISFWKDLGKIIRCLVIRARYYIYVQFLTGKCVLVAMDGRVILERQPFTTVSCRCDILQSKALVCAGNSMKVINISDPKNVTNEQLRFPTDAGTDVSTVAMSTDSQVAEISFGSGVVLVYLVKESASSADIHSRLGAQFTDAAYSFRSVQDWRAAVSQGYKDQHDEDRPGRPQIDNLDIKIVVGLEIEPFVSSRSLGKVLGYATLSDKLHSSLGMKANHLRLISHQLTEQLRAIGDEECCKLFTALEGAQR
jgi:WD40 repeat protein